MKKLLLFLVVLLIIPITFAKTGHMPLLAVSEVYGKEVGAIADLYLEIKPGEGRVFIDTFPLTKLDTQLSTRFAKSIACNFLDKDCSNYDFFYTIRARSSIVGGPSASGSIAVLTVALLDNLKLNDKTAMTGTINSGGIIGPVGSIAAKVIAANKGGIEKVLIPEFGLSESIENITKNLSIEIVNVSTLEDAIFEFTGKRYNKNSTLTIDENYQRVMKNIAEELCGRAENFSKNTYINSSLISSANNSLEEAKELMNMKKYYSAASYCFTANIRYHYTEMMNISRSNMIRLINQTKKEIEDFEDYVDKKEINTLTDLQTFMIVKERIKEAKDKVNESYILYMRRSEESIYSIVFAIERLNSAKTWSQFFDTGKRDTIEKENLRTSCINKLAEAEERLQYVNLYYPAGLLESSKELKYAHEDAENGDYDLCLFKASKAKANADLILTTIGLQENKSQEFLDKKLSLVKNTIANNEFFPIIGYSYYEYAEVLKETDENSAFVYLEYALELSSLELYFKEDRFSLISYFDTRLLAVFGLGVILGIIIGILIKPKKRKHRIKF
jgi:uncharacterized protein